MEGLLDRGLSIKGEGGVDLGRDLAGDDLEDLRAELDEEVVEGRVDLGVEITSALLLGLGDGDIDQSGVLGLLGGGEDQGRVGGGILGLVLANGCELCEYFLSRSRAAREFRLVSGRWG